MRERPQVWWILVAAIGVGAALLIAWFMR